VDVDGGCLALFKTQDETVIEVEWRAIHPGARPDARGAPLGEKCFSVG
jgi:hypothetical protein